MPSILFRALIVLGALWCALLITATLSPPTGNNARLTRAASLEQVSIEIADAPLHKADRIVPSPAPASPVVSAAVGPSAPAGVREEKPATHTQAEHHHHTDRVCGDRGRRYFRRHHHLSWRCRR